MIIPKHLLGVILSNISNYNNFVISFYEVGSYTKYMICRANLHGIIVEKFAGRNCCFKQIMSTICPHKLAEAWRSWQLVGGLSLVVWDSYLSLGQNIQHPVLVSSCLVCGQSWHLKGPPLLSQNPVGALNQDQHVAWGSYAKCCCQLLIVLNELATWKKNQNISHLIWSLMALPNFHDFYRTRTDSKHLTTLSSVDRFNRTVEHPH